MSNFRAVGRVGREYIKQYGKREKANIFTLVLWISQIGVWWLKEKPSTSDNGIVYETSQLAHGRYKQ